MGNFYDDNADLRWYLETGIDWEPVIRLTEYDWKAEDAPESVEEAVEIYRDLLDLIGVADRDRGHRCERECVLQKRGHRNLLLRSRPIKRVAPGMRRSTRD